MKDENLKVLHRLKKSCYITGIFSVFIGISVGFINVMNNDVEQSLVGIFIFIVGYAFFKISSDLLKIIISEKS